jgi:hypothetical protein
MQIAEPQKLIVFFFMEYIFNFLSKIQSLEKIKSSFVHVTYLFNHESAKFRTEINLCLKNLTGALSQMTDIYVYKYFKQQIEIERAMIF